MITPELLAKLKAGNFTLLPVTVEESPKPSPVTNASVSSGCGCGGKAARNVTLPLPKISGTTPNEKTTTKAFLTTIAPNVRNSDLVTTSTVPPDVSSEIEYANSTSTVPPTTTTEFVYANTTVAFIDHNLIAYTEAAVDVYSINYTLVEGFDEKSLNYSRVTVPPEPEPYTFNFVSNTTLPREEDQDALYDFKFSNNYSLPATYEFIVRNITSLPMDNSYDFKFVTNASLVVDGLYQFNFVSNASHLNNLYYH